MKTLLLSILCLIFCNYKIDARLLVKREDKIDGWKLCGSQVPGSFVPHATDCRLFYLCLDNNEAISAICPAGKLFNPDSLLCDVFENVQCLINNNINNNNNNNNNNNIDELTEANKFCKILIPLMQQDNKILYIGSARYCNIYYVCYYGQALQQQCTNDLHWNVKTKKCDLPSSAQCKFTTPTENDPTSNTDFIYEEHDDKNNNNLATIHERELIICPNYGQHIYPHMDRCDFFIYCVKGHATLQRCPFYRHFDIMSNRCQFQHRATCIRDL